MIVQSTIMPVFEELCFILMLLALPLNNLIQYIIMLHISLQELKIHITVFYMKKQAGPHQQQEGLHSIIFIYKCLLQKLPQCITALCKSKTTAHQAGEDEADMAGVLGTEAVNLRYRQRTELAAFGRSEKQTNSLQEAWPQHLCRIGD